jgi:uncharacterized membrane protein YdbT with pleckstrin-like domain
MKSTEVPNGISLSEGEIPIWFGRMSWIATWPLFLLAVIFCWTIIIPILLIIGAVIQVMTSEYFLSNQRIYYKFGLISRSIDDIKIEWVTNTAVYQGFIGRILDYGDVVISTPGSARGANKFTGVHNPMWIKGLIQDALINKKKVDEINLSLTKITDEFKMGRLDEDKYNALKNEYENEIKKYE